MDEAQPHPAWCSRRRCNAYPARPHDREYHRSEPVVVPAADTDTAVIIHRGANPEGDGEYIEIAKIDVAVCGPFYDEEPRFRLGINLPLPLAQALCDAIESSLGLEVHERQPQT